MKLTNASGQVSLIGAHSFNAASTWLFILSAISSMFSVFPMSSQCFLIRLWDHDCLVICFVHLFVRVFILLTVFPVLMMAIISRKRKSWFLQGMHEKFVLKRTHADDGVLNMGGEQGEAWLSIGPETTLLTTLMMSF